MLMRCKQLGTLLHKLNELFTICNKTLYSPTFFIVLIVMTRCGLCSTEISQPVCPLCLTDKFEAWVEKKKLSLVRPFREEVRNMLDKTRYGRISCMKCRSENEKAICISCYAGKIHSFLVKKDEKVAAQFLEDFTPKTERSELYA